MQAFSTVEHNVSLRSLDWRFLLPKMPEDGFQHLIIPGGAPELAEKIAQVGLARQVTTEIPKEPKADALILLHDSPIPLAKALECLIPGGVLYYEFDVKWPQLLTSVPRHIYRTLQKKGLSPCGVYWITPQFNRADVYIPVNVKNALRWYLKTFFKAETFLKRILEPIILVLTHIGFQLFACLSPHFAVTAVVGQEEASSPALLNHNNFPEVLQNKVMHPLVLAGGDDFNRLVLMPFTSDSRKPEAVLKLSRIADRNISIENEQTTLTVIRQKLDDNMRWTVPEPLGMVQSCGIFVGIETCAEGQVISTLFNRWCRPISSQIADMGFVAAWLADFHLQTKISDSIWGEAEMYQTVELPLTTYQEVFGLTPAEEKLFTKVREYSRLLLGMPLPVVLAHWGFSQRNIFKSGRGISVIDWEGGSAGPPLFDLLYFLTDWSFTVQHHHGKKAQLQFFRELFLTQTQGTITSKAIHQVITEYISKLNVDSRFIPVLLILLYVERALGRFERRSKLKSNENPRSGNDYIKYIDVLANKSELFSNLYL